MFTPDISNEKPLYSDVVAIPRYVAMQSQLSSSSTETTDSENDHSLNELELPNTSHLGKETFKIDRRKLETMIQSPSQTIGLVNEAEHFFDKIMKTTDTFISWPRNLRIGARTRKDPFINIVGRPNDINWAKGLILASLATRGPLLKMKIIIADTDHAHIIGRNGINVKGIMDQTDTHIHFPDSNRRTVTEKRHQVSIYGTLESIEQARTYLRSSTPLVMSFELPFGLPQPKTDLPDIKQVEADFGVKIIFMAIPNKSSYFAIIKGTEEGVDKLKEAVKMFVRATCGSRAEYTLSNIKLEVSKHLFDLSREENAINLFELQKKTGTLISFPDSNDDGQKITITGPIEGIYEAKNQIISQLPIELTFDIIDNPFYTPEIMSLGMKYGISISMQHKEKDNTVAITMKSEEKIISHIFEAHQEIAEMQNTSRDETEFPKAYFLVEPSYRKALENNINSDLNKYEEISRKIWAPLEPNTESNFLHVQPSAVDSGISSLYYNLDNNTRELFEQNIEALPPASFSPGATCSSDDSSQGSDWSLMREVHNDNQHYECDFDSEDMEVAFIFMASTKNITPVYPNAPGAERVCRR
ncbi:protein bicaudal C-like [Episyrphus balteatus]|uniref:protein bicaudal C-like n=1 Tax=Episyrphus balteatus TaxID=286459 RepID=UPI002484F054|nr:protein bicaudal C-like [Episyrphus balteatus]